MSCDMMANDAGGPDWEGYACSTRKREFDHVKIVAYIQLVR